MMVNRRHAKDALAGQFVGSDLQHYRHRLEHENAAHHEQHDFLAHDHGNRAEGRTDRESSHVAHEYLRRIGVEPKEAEAGADQARAKDQDLTDAGDVGNLQIARELEIAGRIGEHAERARHHDGGHDRETIEAIREIHGVAGADDHEIREGDEQHDAHRHGNALEERHVQRGLGGRVVQIKKRERGREPDQGLREVLVTRRQALGVTDHQFQIVVVEADHAERERRQQQDPNEAVGQVRPQQSRERHAEQHQAAAHRRCAGLRQV